MEWGMHLVLMGAVTWNCSYSESCKQSGGVLTLQHLLTLKHQLQRHLLLLCWLLSFCEFSFHKPKKLAFSNFGSLRKKKQDDVEEYVCPMELGRASGSASKKGFKAGLDIRVYDDDDLDRLEQVKLLYLNVLLDLVGNFSFTMKPFHSFSLWRFSVLTVTKHYSQTQTCLSAQELQATNAAAVRLSLT